MNISIVILTKNEENNIIDLKKNLDFSNDILLIDDFSKDNTYKCAKSTGIRVIQNKLDHDFSSQKNFGLSNVKHKWVLFLDADERLSDSLKDEIMSLNLEDTDVNGYYLKRKDYFLGIKLKYGEVKGKKLIRLARKDKGKWKRSVHEYWDIKGKVKTLKHPIIHKTNNDLNQFIRKINFYSTIHAKENKNEGKISSLTKIVLYPIGKFMYNYFVKLGFLDGTKGLVHAMFMSLHSFLSWTKLWLIQKNSME